ncbi:MAG: 1-(5-phosphoribosyl)-5-[(5-phosphoribosylamino)methylideneamino]imidazole-4-carboxamide isomerase [Gammaproteobacteria bacterium]|jgi:phosphoribosylformimino-5-aminoimidazole carboxamide ribotide isomerase|nr:1-(5-phosphoribosyl)-5-[(5-phosphoribosylamino)methylideneamino]imidazole-4-carboxamide isomerase [Pseudomonadota bacterium]MDG2302301.1 1-(5-phosphoribosyl)-5-[(5-phosphoribosylamino)methylideneamino]imidazole-4-carboxamide isomerase [Gammaproteobacteria bacterium]MBT5065790.1 1-(5-phosphoribosyl)-5-[(5-phosphoribosylamino)methylideneamino]imidazole-4-carboxamide isomerase [Pseudomonadota bacterium]MBT6192791.1 1-(5-phosphoribosyl)-5-[(5-phosphoribosylamino)methylideneamino]imidazole-4-carbo
MILIPAIDLKGGKCVRLVQGDMKQDTIYSDDPLAMAARWVDEGAKRLHVVDLDGAFGGAPANRQVIHDIASAFPEVAIQVGGGIRDEDTIQSYLDAGVSYVIIGTKAVTAPHFVSDVCIEFPNHIIVGLDVRDGKVAIDGWSKLSKHNALDLALQFENDGVQAIIYTDIGRDGMMMGLNIDSTAALARALKIPVIASGGVTNLEDIRGLAEVEDDGVAGAITGKAIYEGTLDFAEAQKLADELTG